MRAYALALLSLAALAGCLDESASGPAPAPAGTSTLSLVVAPVSRETAARAASADPGGVLVVELANPTKGVRMRDSAAWTGSAEIRIGFAALTEGTGYVAKAWYRDPQGFATHGDSIAGITLARGQDASLALSLRALLGRIVLNAPSLPTSVDTLAISWASKSAPRTARVARGSGGRTSLRLDSLPVGQEGTVRLRAWNAARDTLFHLDTLLTLSGDADLPLSLLLQSSKGQILASAVFQAGAEIDATASFAGESEQPVAQTGRLLLVAFSDSGASDWVAVRNPGTAPFSGGLRLGKGGTDAQFTLDLPAGEVAVITRAPCAAIDSSHPLHGARHLVCGLEDVVVTHSTAGGSLWKLRGADAQEMLDEVFVLDGRQSWPDLNTSNARTARLRRGWASAAANDAGRAWCADGSDLVDGTCP